MNDGMRRTGSAVSLGAVALLLTGCGGGTYTGGGWLRSASGGTAKATFGFKLECVPGTETISGQFEYVDRAANVRFHAVPDTMVVKLGDTWIDAELCGSDPLDPDFVFFGGNYRTGGAAAGPSGRYIVTFSDDGEPGPSSGDSFCLFLRNGPYDGYQNCNGLSG